MSASQVTREVSVDVKLPAYDLEFFHKCIKSNERTGVVRVNISILRLFIA